MLTKATDNQRAIREQLKTEYQNQILQNQCGQISIDADLIFQGMQKAIEDKEKEFDIENINKLINDGIKSNAEFRESDHIKILLPYYNEKKTDAVINVRTNYFIKYMLKDILTGIIYAEMSIELINKIYTLSTGIKPTNKGIFIFNDINNIKQITKSNILTDAKFYVSFKDIQTRITPKLNVLNSKELQLDTEMIATEVNEILKESEHVLVEDIADIKPCKIEQQILLTSLPSRITELNENNTQISMQTNDDCIIYDADFSPLKELSENESRCISAEDRYILTRAMSLYSQKPKEHNSERCTISLSELSGTTDRHKERTYDELMHKLARLNNIGINERTGEIVSNKRVIETHRLLNFNPKQIISVNGRLTPYGIAIVEKPILLKFAERKNTIAWIPNALFKVPGLNTTNNNLEVMFYIIDYIYDTTNMRKGKTPNIQEFFKLNNIVDKTEQKRTRKIFRKVLQYYAEIGIIKYQFEQGEFESFKVINRPKRNDELKSIETKSDDKK